MQPDTLLGSALPASLALAAAAFVAREVLVALLHAAIQDGWAALRARLNTRLDDRTKRRPARQGNGG